MTSRRPIAIRELFAFGLWLCLGVVLCRSLPVAAAPSIEALLRDGAEQQKKVRDLEQRLNQAAALSAAHEKRAAAAAREIERLKSQPQGVARDLALGERLAQAQAQATELAQEEQARRRLMQELLSTRRQLLSTCDRILEADQDPGKGAAGLLSAQRIGWLRLRTAQVEAILGEGNAAKARALAQSEIAAGSVDAASIDEPQALRERADLLRDSADKLRREVLRLQARSEELLRRQRMRERASRVDEDLFAEQSTARRGSTSRGGAAGATLADAKEAAPAAPGPTASSAPPAPVFAAPLPSSAPDPSTLDALLRVEGPGDPSQKLQALSRAESELSALAIDLQKRAALLEKRAAELGRQK